MVLGLETAGPGIVATVTSAGGFVLVDDRINQPLTSIGALPALNSSMNSSLVPLAPRKRYSLITMPDVLPVCAPACSCHGESTAPSNVANAKDKPRDLMT